VDIPFRNAGKGLLELTIVEVSCDCLHAIHLDGKKLEGGQPTFVAPGKEGVLSFHWKPGRKQLPEGSPPKELLITIQFVTNDPQNVEPRIEIKTRLVQTKEENPTREGQ
jgi:hypothetical protein